MTDETLWWDAKGSRYWRWDGRGDASDDPVELVSLAGTRRAARMPLEGACELSREAVIEALSPRAKAAIEALGGRLGALDPSLSGLEDLASLGTRKLDMQPMIERLTQRFATEPDLAQAMVTDLVDEVTTLARIVAFGDVGRPLLARLGFAPDASDASSSADDAARIAHVRAEVRAELDARAAGREPLSFDFDDLVRGR